jgi:hypothetical protein
MVRIGSEDSRRRNNVLILRTIMLPPQNRPLFRHTLSCPLLPTRRLRYEPLGGDGLGVNLHRDFGKTHGVATEYTAELSYVKDGRAYLDRAYRAGGIEADVRALTEQYDPNNFQWLPYYKGRVNYTSAEFSATQVKVNIEQQNWLQKFLSRDSVDVDLFSGDSVSGNAGPIPQPVSVELHSRAVLQRYAASQKAAVKTTTQMYGDEDDPSREQLLYFGFDTPETNEVGLGAVTGGWVSGGASDAVPIFTADGTSELSIDLDLRAHITAYNNGQGPEFKTVEGDCFLRVVSGGSPQNIPLIPAFYQGNLGGDYVGDILTGAQRFTFHLEKGDEVYLYARYYIHDVGGLGTGVRYRSTLDATFLPGAYFRFSAVTTTAATQTKGLLLYEACERLCQALTDEPEVFRSEFLGRTDLGYAKDGPGALTMITGGFQVRGFPLLTDPAPAAGSLDLRKSLTTNWRELFDSLASVYGLGWGLEWAIGRKGDLIEVIRVESLSYFYKDDVVLDLAEAFSLSETRTKVSATDFYQVAEFGYDKWQSESVNGLDEYNAKRQWTTPLTVVKSTYSQISQLSASGTLLEATRRDRFDATATTDTGSDATNFLVCLLRDDLGGYVTERNQLATTLTGTLSPSTVYNLRLSPARMLRSDHGRALRAGLLPIPGAVVRATSGAGNGTLVSQLLGEPAPIAESADVLRRPTSRIRFRDERGDKREGWILDFKHVAEQETGDFTLLLCA